MSFFFFTRTRFLAVNNFLALDFILSHCALFWCRPIVFTNYLKPYRNTRFCHYPLISNGRDNNKKYSYAGNSKILRNLILCDRQYRRRVTRTRHGLSINAVLLYDLNVIKTDRLKKKSFSSKKLITVVYKTFLTTTCH